MRITVEEASQKLLNGEVVAIPTETVYGLAAALDKPDAIRRVFAIKGRPAQNPLIIHVHDPSIIKKYSDILPDGWEKLAAAFWPGPLTLVISVDVNKIPEEVRAGLPTAAFRIPQHPLALKLLAATGPLVMPSANLSGSPSSTQAKHVEEDFGYDFPILDGGMCQFGLESTIVMCRNQDWQIIRQGALHAEMFEPVLGYIPTTVINCESIPVCPGQMFRHYAPKAKLVLGYGIALYEGVIVGFKDRNYPRASRVFYLGYSYDPAAVAENLYAVLRELDQEGIKSAFVDMELPNNASWSAILERLHKAAAS